MDVDIFIDKNSLKSKIHIKNTNTMQYLHYTSCHPAHVKKSIPKSLSLRAQILCSDQKDFNNYVEKLSCSLAKRGYPEKLIKAQTKAKKNNNPSSIAPEDPKFITRYHPGLHKINKILKIALPILETNQDTKKLFSKPPRTIFRKPPNLKNILSHPKLEQPKILDPSKCYPCKKPRCGTCKILQDSSSYTSSTTNRIYPIKGNINCNTSNVIYQLKCKHCPKDYIGKTITPLRIRMTNHRFDIFHQNAERPVSAHAISHNETKIEECYELRGIYSEKPGLDINTNALKIRNIEVAHQLILKSRLPDGLNIR